MDAIKQYHIDFAARAAYEGDLATVKRYIERERIDVNSRNSANTSILHRAAFGGHLEIVEYLLAKGANPNITTPNGQTPLMHAVASTNFKLKLGDMLIAAGADITQRIPSGAQPIDFLAGNNGVSPDALRWIASKGVDISANTSTSNAPFIISAIKRRNIPLVQAYIDSGGRLDVTDSSGNTPLHHAIDVLEPKIVEAVIAGAKAQNLSVINTAALNGSTPMIRVAGAVNWPDAEEMTAEAKRIIARQESIAKLLLAEGADINLVNLGNESPLMVAADKGNPLMVSLLLERGANPKMQNEQGYSAYTAAIGSGKTEVAALLVQHMKDDPYFQRNAAALPVLDKNNLAESLVANGTSVAVYSLSANTYDFRYEGSQNLAPLPHYKPQRQGNLLIIEAESEHHIGTYFSALNTYTRLTGTPRAQAERMILPVKDTIEPLGNFAEGISPTSQMVPGLRALLEGSNNKAIRNATFASISYYMSDEDSFYYDSQRAQTLKEAAAYYGSLDLGGIGFAVANDANDKLKGVIGKSQPWRSNPGTLFIGAARRSDQGDYLMDNYADRGPQITAPLPPYYNKIENEMVSGTSFAAPAFNAYRLALYNGTAHLTPREVDAALMVTADTRVRDDNADKDGGKPYSFVSNGTVLYNEKVGVGVANIGKAYERALQLDAAKRDWLKTHSEDKPIELVLAAPTAPRRLEVNGAVKYEYNITVPSDVYIQQLTSQTLAMLNSDGKPVANQSRIILPSGIAQQARADVYGNASLPAAYGVRIAAGETIRIISDQPLSAPTIDINGYAPDSFFATIMRQAQADRAKEQLQASGVTTVPQDKDCETVASGIYNAGVALCPPSQRSAR